MVHDTHMSQYIPPTLFHFSTATMTEVAGQAVGTICEHRTAVNQTTLATFPIVIVSNDSPLKGSYLNSIEIDYEVLNAEPTSITWTVNKVTRGANTAVAVVAPQTKTDSLLAAAAKTVDQHKITLTITTPFWIDQNEYVLVEASIVAGGGGNTMDFLSAVANFTERL